MKKAGIVIIIALALLLGLSSFAAAADVVASGACGENASDRKPFDGREWYDQGIRF